MDHMDMDMDMDMDMVHICTTLTFFLAAARITHSTHVKTRRSSGGLKISRRFETDRRRKPQRQLARRVVASAPGPCASRSRVFTTIENDKNGRTQTC